jgi:hypothetical protein
MKSHEYMTIVIEDRGHLDSLGLLEPLNQYGHADGKVDRPCPVCKATDHAYASGWKHREDQPKGSNKLCVLMEREVEFLCPELLGG